LVCHTITPIIAPRTARMPESMSVREREIERERERERGRGLDGAGGW